MNDILSDFKEILSDIRDICIEEGIFSAIFAVLFLLLYVFFGLLFLPFVAFNAWSKTWFKHKG